MARPNEYCERMLAPSPLPVTRPMRAQIIWMPIISGSAATTVHKVANP